MHANQFVLIRARRLSAARSGVAEISLFMRVQHKALFACRSLLAPCKNATQSGLR